MAVCLLFADNRPIMVQRRYGHAPFVLALGSRKDHRTATLRVCFHALQLTKLIERANRNQFEAHEVGLSQR